MQCDVCSGSGLIERENKEELAKTSPILAQHKTTCWKCGGGGSLSAAEAKRIAQVAAKASNG